MGNSNSASGDRPAAAADTGVRSIATTHLRAYEVLIAGFVNALRTQSRGLVETALDDLFFALSNDLCAVQYLDSNGHSSSSSSSSSSSNIERHSNGIPHRGNTELFRRQLAIRAIVLNGTSSPGTQGGTGSQNQSFDSHSRSISSAVVSQVPQWAQSPLSSLSFFELAQHCLGGLENLGLRVRRRIVLITLILLGYDADFGDIVGPTSAPTDEALAADREVVSAWKASHRAAYSKDQGFLALRKIRHRLQPGMPTINVPKVGDCQSSRLRAALRLQCFFHRRAFGLQTGVIQTLLDALFSPETDTGTRLLFIRLLCLLGTENDVCDRLVAVGAFDAMAIALNEFNTHVQIDVLQSICRLIMHRQEDKATPVAAAEEVPGSSPAPTRRSQPRAADADRHRQRTVTPAQLGQNKLRAFLRERNETPRVRNLRMCLASQLAPTLFFKIISNDAVLFGQAGSFNAPPKQGSHSDTHLLPAHGKCWNSYAHCLLAKLAIDILADVALTDSSCHILSRLTLSSALPRSDVNTTSRSSTLPPPGGEDNTQLITTATHILFQRLADSISLLRDSSFNRRGNELLPASRPCEYDLRSPAIYHAHDTMVRARTIREMQERYFDSLCLLVCRIVASERARSLVLLGLPDGTPPITNALHVLAEALRQTEYLKHVARGRAGMSQGRASHRVEGLARPPGLPQSDGSAQLLPSLPLSSSKKDRHLDVFYCTTQLSLLASVITMETAAQTMLSDLQRAQLKGYRPVSAAQCSVDILPHAFEAARASLGKISSGSAVSLTQNAEGEAPSHPHLGTLDEVVAQFQPARLPAWWIQVAQSLSQLHSILFGFATGAGTSDTVAHVGAHAVRLCFYIFDAHTISQSHSTTTAAAAAAAVTAAEGPTTSSIPQEARSQSKKKKKKQYSFVYPMYCVELALEMANFLALRSPGALLLIDADALHVTRRHVAGKCIESNGQIVKIRLQDTLETDGTTQPPNASAFLECQRHFVRAFSEFHGAIGSVARSDCLSKVTSQFLRSAPVESLTNQQLEALRLFHGSLSSRPRRDVEAYLAHLGHIGQGENVVVHVPTQKGRVHKVAPAPLLVSMVNFSLVLQSDRDSAGHDEHATLDGLINSILASLAVVCNSDGFLNSLGSALDSVCAGKISENHRNQGSPAAKRTWLMVLLRRYCHRHAINVSDERLDGVHLQARSPGNPRSLVTSDALQAVYELDALRNWPRLLSSSRGPDRTREARFISVAVRFSRVLQVYLKDADGHLSSKSGLAGGESTLRALSAAQELSALLLSLAKFAEEDARVAFHIASRLQEEVLAVLKLRASFVPIHRCCSILLRELTKRPCGLTLWLQPQVGAPLHHQPGLNFAAETPHQRLFVADTPLYDSSGCCALQVILHPATTISRLGATLQQVRRVNPGVAGAALPPPAGDSCNGVAPLHSLSTAENELLTHFSAGQKFGPGFIDFISVVNRGFSLLHGNDKDWDSGERVRLVDDFTLSSWFRIPPPPPPPAERGPNDSSQAPPQEAGWSWRLARVESVRGDGQDLSVVLVPGASSTSSAWPIVLSSTSLAKGFAPSKRTVLTMRYPRRDTFKAKNGRGSTGAGGTSDPGRTHIEQPRGSAESEANVPLFGTFQGSSAKGSAPPNHAAEPKHGSAGSFRFLVLRWLEADGEKDHAVSHSDKAIPHVGRGWQLGYQGPDGVFRGCSIPQSTFSKHCSNVDFRGSEGIASTAPSNAHLEPSRNNNAMREQPVIVTASGVVSPDTRSPGSTRTSFHKGDFVYVKVSSRQNEQIKTPAHEGNASPSSPQIGGEKLRCQRCEVLDARWHFLKLECSFLSAANSFAQGEAAGRSSSTGRRKGRDQTPSRGDRVASIKVYCDNLVEPIGSIRIPSSGASPGAANVPMPLSLPSTTSSAATQKAQQMQGIEIVGVGNIRPHGLEPSCDLADLRLYDRISSISSSTQINFEWQACVAQEASANAPQSVQDVQSILGSCAVWTASSVDVSGNVLDQNQTECYLLSGSWLVDRRGRTFEVRLDEGGGGGGLYIADTAWVMPLDSATTQRQLRAGICEWVEKLDAMHVAGGRRNRRQRGRTMVWSAWKPLVRSTFDPAAREVFFYLYGDRWVWDAVLGLSEHGSSSSTTTTTEEVIDGKRFHRVSAKRVARGSSSTVFCSWVLGGTGWEMDRVRSSDTTIHWFRQHAEGGGGGGGGGARTYSSMENSKSHSSPAAKSHRPGRWRLSFRRQQPSHGAAPTPTTAAHYDYELFHGQPTWALPQARPVHCRRIARELGTLTQTRCVLLNHQLLNAMLRVLSAGGGRAQATGLVSCDIEVAEQLVEALSCLLMVDTTAKWDIVATKGYLSTIFKVKYSPLYHQHWIAHIDVPGSKFERALEEALRTIL